VRLTSVLDGESSQVQGPIYGSSELMSTGDSMSATPSPLTPHETQSSANKGLLHQISLDDGHGLLERLLLR
jgi:hypothetical protein